MSRSWSEWWSGLWPASWPVPWPDLWPLRRSAGRSRRVVIGLAPEGLSALVLRGRARPHLLDRHVVPLREQGASRWEAGVAALEELLAQPGWRNGEITIILSSHYVRHVVMPPVRDLAEAEVNNLAQLVFNDIFGDLARDWEFRVAPARAGATSLACGVPLALLNALRAACAPHGRLRAIQPGLMPVFNRVRREIGNSAACLALVEPGRVTLASVDNEQWAYVDSRAGDGTILPQLLLEESELHDRPPGGILWLCDLTGTTRLPSDSFWSYRRITPPPLPDFDIPSLAIWGLP